MEVAVAKALKPSLRREFIFQQMVNEEILCFNANAAVVGDDFSVDDLLDFSDGEFQPSLDEENVSSHSQDHDSNSNSTTVSYDSIFSTELTVPASDLADLEWVSHYVDDSVPELSLLYPVRSEQTNTWLEPEHKPELTVCSMKKTTRFPCEMMKITTKARTTKSRKPNPRVWSLSTLLTRPSSPSSCSSVFSSTAPPVVYGEPPAKKQKKKSEAVQSGGAQFQRRCSHCQVQKTPQWRTGPLGPKTLCNACGVRYKSGRLFSEYRPACSPTFCSDIHSNSHRKVLEIRKKKGMGGPEPGLTQTQMVPTC